ncbi:MAG: hypothetical protein AAGA56_15315, partial [Myxococcota bacterium]
RPRGERERSPRGECSPRGGQRVGHTLNSAPACSRGACGVRGASSAAPGAVAKASASAAPERVQAARRAVRRHA